ncbi:proprotein convertase P-domain-containing protein [Lentzea sp. HUAS12]|uniref:proprotein convertase P-domain-containing protein n=1 Tax=Lentzea sp. HUAS12 TaxID=2951806 RepID=UPI0020A13045|nr:proprotein convertase P-domain-containing protein [Lentzea sp. HUAS12]USX55072.1 proprotein convertase P-domain-containing protein [Lentzea sp. HUAS12]
MRVRSKIIAAACGSVLAIGAFGTTQSAAQPDAATLQAEAHQRFDGLSQDLRGQLAGHWFDAAAGRLTVAVPTEKVARQARSEGVNAVVVQRSATQLEKLLGDVRSLIGDGVPGVFSWGVDVRDNEVDVTVNTSSRTEATDRFLSKVRGLDGVHVVETKSQQRQQAGTVQAGSPWWPGSESNCSIGFAATDASGGKHFLTAGHCTNDANQAAYGQSGQQNRLGTSNTGGTRSVNAREGDMGVVAVTEPGWTLSASVNTWGQPAVTVTGSAEAMVGDRVCHSGNTSKWQCGEVKYTNKAVDYGGGLVIEGLTWTTACSKGGDSGGAWLLGDKAVGLHDGGPSQCVQNPSDDELSLFQPVNEALRKWNLTLVTGTGSGDTTAPTTPGTLRSTGVSASSASLTWDASTDNVGVTAYEVLNGTAVATTVTGTTATVTGLTADTAYTFAVRAVDAAGNRSAPSSSLGVRTSAGGSGRTFSSDTDYAIRDYQVVASPVRSTAAGAAGNPMTVKVDATHTCLEDLNVTLVAPSGRTYPLMRTPGGGYACHPFVAGRTFSVVPGAGEAASGTWTLRVGDNGPGDMGVLSGWSLTV